MQIRLMLNALEIENIYHSMSERFLSIEPVTDPNDCLFTLGTTSARGHHQNVIWRSGISPAISNASSLITRMRSDLGGIPSTGAV